MAKKKFNASGIVYSTEPGFQFEENTPDQTTVLPAEQKLKIRLETKHRAGKAVTLVENFIGSEEDRQTLGKNLKSFCGTGGSVKDGEIIIQGDHRDKALQYLLKNGYKQSKKV